MGKKPIEPIDPESPEGILRRIEARDYKIELTFKTTPAAMTDTQRAWLQERSAKIIEGLLDRVRPKPSEAAEGDKPEDEMLPF